MQHVLHMHQRDPEVFVGQVFLWSPGVPGPKTYTFSRNGWFFGLAAEGGKAKKHYIPKHVWFLGLGTPGLPENTWPTNHFGIKNKKTKTLGSL
jgi:hypothetical protein